MSNENEIKLVQVSHLEDDNEVLYDLVYNSVEDKIYLVNATTEGEISLDDLPTDVDLGTWEGLIEIVALAQAKLNSAVNAHKGNNTETRIVKRYVRTVWQDNVTALDAENMNNIENGIYFAHERLNNIDKAFNGETGTFYKDINLNGNVLGNVGTAKITTLKVNEVKSTSEVPIKVKSSVDIEKDLNVDGKTNLNDVNVNGSLIVTGSFNGYETIGVGAIDSFNSKNPSADDTTVGEKNGKPAEIKLKKDLEFDINGTGAAGNIKNVETILTETDLTISLSEGKKFYIDNNVDGTIQKVSFNETSINFYSSDDESSEYLTTFISGNKDQAGHYKVGYYDTGNNFFDVSDPKQDWTIFSRKENRSRTDNKGITSRIGTFGVDKEGNIYTVGDIKTPKILINDTGAKITGDTKNDGTTTSTTISDGSIVNYDAPNNSYLTPRSLNFYTETENSDGTKTQKVKTIVSGTHGQNTTYSVNNGTAKNNWVLYSSKNGGTTGEFGVDTNGNIYTSGNLSVGGTINCVQDITAPNILVMENKLKNVTNVVNFIGAYYEEPAASNCNEGDVYVNTQSSLEYILSDGAWVKLGNSSAKQNIITGAASTITDTNLTKGRVLISNSTTGKVDVSNVTIDELHYLSGVTSNIQSQLNGKSARKHTHTELVTKQSTSKSITISYGTETEMNGLSSPEQGDIFFVIK